MDKGLLLVTGATGLVGSNLCIAAKKAGYRVRALVRSPADAELFRPLGIDTALGDVTDPASLAKAAAGAGAIAHTAAVIGGTWSKATADDFWRVNYHGVVNLLDAARQAGVTRTLCYSTIGILDWSRTAGNSSPITPIAPNDSPYIRAKRAAFYESMRRASIDQDIVTVMPGMIYGSSPFLDRAVVPTSVNGTILLAASGSLAEYIPMPLTWSYVHDVVAIGLAALEKGSNGSRFLASGRAEDVCSFADFCNRANAIAGIAHRVRHVDLSAAGNIGTMKNLAERRFASPLVDPSETQAALGIAPTTLDAGLQETVDWLRTCGKL